MQFSNRSVPMSWVSSLVLQTDSRLLSDPSGLTERENWREKRFAVLAMKLSPIPKGRNQDTGDPPRLCIKERAKRFVLWHHFGVERCFFCGRSPCGRQSNITSSNMAIKMTRRLADWVAEKGRYLVRKSVPAQIPHTVKLPRIAPLLLPLPPRINITQMINVP